MRDLFEFWCAKGNGGCDGYVMIPLQTDDERDIILVCPNCGHEHYRGMKNGQITEARHSVTKDNEKVHRIEPLKSSYSKTSQLKAMEEKGPLGSLWARFGRSN